jgi:hypothetical protein
MKRILTVISLLVISSYNINAVETNSQAEIIRLLSMPYNQMVHELHAITLQRITANDENKSFNDSLKENIGPRLNEIELWIKPFNDANDERTDDPKKGLISENLNVLEN